MKTIFFCAALVFGCMRAFSQDTTYQEKGDIHLKETNPSMDLPPIGSGPDQGGNQGWIAKHDTTRQVYYCMNMKDGRVVLEQNGQVPKKTVKLDNGATVTKNGMVTRKNGTQMQLQNGDCIARNGTIH